MTRKQRIQIITTPSDTDQQQGSYNAHAIPDAITATILQSSREGLGAILEGKTWALDRALLAGKERTEKKSRLPRWLKKTRRGVWNRLINSLNALADTAGSAGIVTVDILNALIGDIADIPRFLTGKPRLAHTGQGTAHATIHGIQELLLRQLLQEGIAKSVLLNKSRTEQAFPRETQQRLGSYDLASGRYWPESSPNIHIPVSLPPITTPEPPSIPRTPTIGSRPSPGRSVTLSPADTTTLSPSTKNPHHATRRRVIERPTTTAIAA